MWKHIVAILRCAAGTYIVLSVENKISENGECNIIVINNDNTCD